MEPTWSSEDGNVQLYLGDALEITATLTENSVHGIITDLPYGTTQCQWDVIIPFIPMWTEVKRLLRPHGAFITTASQPFTSALVMSNPEWFRYEWIWEKSKATGFLDCKKKPLKAHENVLVFSRDTPIYNPQMREGENHVRGRKKHQKSEMYGGFNDGITESNLYYPRSVFYEKHQSNPVHPTQKPVPLMEYLIRTYTNEDDVVLDFCMGSGTTGVACINTRRRFIGIENNEEYFNIAVERIKETLRIQESIPVSIFNQF